MKEMTYEAALDRCEALCSRCEHSTGEIARKLRQWRIAERDAERIIDHLIDERYIDNGRYARAFTLDKLRYNQWGRIKIAQALRMNGVSEAEVRTAFQHIDAEEYAEVLRLVLDRKERQLTDEDEYVRRTKLVRHALSHGFEMEVVLAAIGD